jgi:hypothetical protein
MVADADLQAGAVDLQEEDVDVHPDNYNSNSTWLSHAAITYNAGSMRQSYNYQYNRQ